MDEPKPLDSLFKEKLFRIPDYQRGYAWGTQAVGTPSGRISSTCPTIAPTIPAC